MSSLDKAWPDELEADHNTTQTKSHCGPGSRSRSRPGSDMDTDSDSQSRARPQDTLLEVVDTPDRGMAVFARRKIKAGTTVMAEHPLILLHKDEETDPAAIEREFAGLSRSDQKSYLRLWDAQKSRMSRVVSIYYSNCHNCDAFIKPKSETTDAANHEPESEPELQPGTNPRADSDSKVKTKATHGDGGGGSAIGAFSSRFNHSCVPNVQFSYDETTNEMRFRAIRDIPRGKEVCTNYDKTVFEGAAKRRRKQQIYYGFVCACEACEPRTEFWARSDERRRGMYDAFRTVLGCEKRYTSTITITSTHQQHVRGVRTATETAMHGQHHSLPKKYEAKDKSNGQDFESESECFSIVDEAFAALAKLEALLLKEGLVGGPLANTYRSMAKWAERRGDMTQAARWKGKERDVCLVIFGESATSIRTKEIEEKLRKFDNTSDKGTMSRDSRVLTTLR
ncbi:hypothetical protein A1O1_00890 [Capronia coronata CBS 617.96]|uniref:SET domain-containing protein n=1 Tax=Capronia coronata CBS 617.96 TaxID=1182541 RepID=W9Z2G6_9EURO|nr:uncharacterized protein A1O1_00890 [Capronia coronata CBS 617.96]EXJ95766.1 hypothetical protein A1O1_00890 [Capronia coronata CBS 617.96]